MSLKAQSISRIPVFIMTLALIALGPDRLRAAEHEPRALGALVERVAEATAEDQHPVVIFDLDDTLINSRERTLRVLRDFAALPSTRASHPAEAEEIGAVRFAQIHYLLPDTLHELGIFDQALIDEAGAFWASRFFTSAYCVADRPNPGAVEYANALAAAGATVVYLTGRDAARMGDGTIASLTGLGFPAGTKGARLVMKEDPKMDDLVFKKSQFARISWLGAVVGVFENEPANINAMHDAFPGAIAIFLDTIHSPKPDVVEDGVFWVGDFRPES